MPSSLDLNEFTLETLVFEVRYDDAYGIWDHAGEIWTALSTRLPGVVLQTAEPKSQMFWLGDTFELFVELKRVAVADNKPTKEGERLAEVATHVLDQAIKSLHIADFSRVGLRAVFWMETKTIDNAVKKLAGTRLTCALEIPLLSKDANQTEIQYTTRFETAAAGIAVKIGTQTRQVNMDVPPNARRFFEPKKVEQHGTLVDFDYYTRGIVSAEQVRPRVWIDQALKTARRAFRGLMEA
jgi:hypothetical protein